MPNTKSAEKRLRQSAKSRRANVAAISRMKTEVKKALAAGKKDREAVLAQAYRFIDKAAAKGVIHPNAAARRKSRLAARLAAR